MANTSQLASLLKGLLDATPDLIFAKDLDYRYIIHNEAFSHLVGRPGANLAGLRDEDIFTDGDAINRLRTTDEKIILQRETIHAQESATYPDGRQILLDTLKAPFYDSEGRLVGLLGVSRDVTKRVAAEQAANVEKEKALLASQAKSEFLAKMSHEIRTPMNAVIGLSKLLRKTALAETQQDHVDKIISSAEVLLNIINDILDYSKIEAKRMPLEQAPFDLHSVISRTVTLCELKAQEKGIELIVQVPSDLPAQLVGDQHRLQQVLVNLTSNAIKFTEQGQVLLRVTIDPCADETATLGFAVIDSGIGIAEEHQQQLFSSFCQVDNSFTRRFEGTGLGLAISKQIVELMGGDISLESTVGVGSTFSFSISCPLHRPDTVPAQVTHYPDLKALIVDDNDIARSIVHDLLIELGISVDCAASGHEAVARVVQARNNRSEYDLILMDWKMPELDGISTAASIKQELSMAHIPAILLLSAYDLDEARQIGATAPIDAYLEKPVNAEALREAIRNTLNVTVAANQGRATDKPDYSGARLLIVDDNAINRTVILGMLKETGAVMEIAVNGLEALEKVKDRAYDLVLMDIQMPVMDGLTATRRIRQEPGLQTLPIVAMTANAMAEDEQRSFLAGMNGHITKPIDADALCQMLTRLLPVGPASTTRPPVDATTSKQPLLARVAAIPALSTTEGLARCGGRLPLYESILIKFIKENEQVDATLWALYQEQQFDDLFILSHSLKTSATYIGALSLSDAAARLEQLAKSQVVTAQAVKQVSTLTIALVTQLQQAIAPPTASQIDSAEQTQPKLPDLLRRLQPLLASSDFAAEQYLPELLDVSRHTPWQHYGRKIDHLVSAIQFERASEQCEQWLEQLDEWHVEKV